MADQLTDDQLADLFAGLRADTVAAVLPPGADAARHTVRRRRQARAAVTGGLAVAAVAGVVGVAVAGTPAAPPAEPTGPLPTADRSALRDLAESVLPPDARSAAAWSFSLGDETSNTAGELPAGSYRMVVACAGDGGTDVLVRWTPRGEDNLFDPERAVVVATGETACAAAPSPATLRFVTPRDGEVMVSVEAVDGAAGRAGFAYRIVPAR
ncbi:hypothetical protein [Spirilliplanes yamanashiensis]|uniref:Uncharacterized protein n=1 Tax=Spirilliplanes yamanashiensis TaxID=42233 RepID=A0A8J3Y9M3_9ACTN|nr:hypothetical protein [Spirilliplanes yamanashiensis]MDP9815800.1 hypothetical protein [Spirilliplanes yamanashiensis]GIJ04054.1 hypothetical protein Sya03_34060 [Spirilliplanes yamanashiensis]